MLAARLRTGELRRADAELLALLGDLNAQLALGVGPAPVDLDAWAHALDAHGPAVGLRAHAAAARSVLDACGSGRARAQRVIGYALGWAEADALPPERRAEVRWISARAMHEETLSEPPPTPAARWILRAPEVVSRGWASVAQGAPDVVRAGARGAIEAELGAWARGG